MNKEDFVFDRLDKEYEDYWFKVEGKSKEILTEKYMEQSMISVTDVVYSKKEDVIGIKRLFPFNYHVAMDNDNVELKEILMELIENIE